MIHQPEGGSQGQARGAYGCRASKCSNKKNTPRGGGPTRRFSFGGKEPFRRKAVTRGGLSSYAKSSRGDCYSCPSVVGVSQGFWRGFAGGSCQTAKENCQTAKESFQTLEGSCQTSEGAPGGEIIPWRGPPRGGASPSLSGGFALPRPVVKLRRELSWGLTTHDTLAWGRNGCPRERKSKGAHFIRPFALKGALRAPSKFNSQRELSHPQILAKRKRLPRGQPFLLGKRSMFARVASGGLIREGLTLPKPINSSPNEMISLGTGVEQPPSGVDIPFREISEARCEAPTSGATLAKQGAKHRPREQKIVGAYK
ncbi:hypothetical protein RRG08_003610 [Elysia crispata]|uniref:Uncharacterized protein n=1 Tax=Elysia crispata TaxID=231223 RepID=A0AAE1D3S2_9GAST|nr:hypothetical protein RRG08_003610 [Elysia crispata]